MWPERIPKILFAYWDMSNLSFLHYLTIVSFMKYNPLWQIQLYYPKFPFVGKLLWQNRAQKDPYIGINYLEYLKKLKIKFIEIDFNDIGFVNDVPENMKSNYLKFFIGSTQGGVWTDMDILFFKSLEEIKFDNVNVDTVFCYDRRINTFCVGFVMMSNNNNVYKYFLENAAKQIDLYTYQCLGPDFQNKTLVDFNHAKLLYPNNNIMNLAETIVYPYTYQHMQSIFNKIDLDYISENSVCIHWFGASHITKEFLNTYDHTNIAKSNSSIGEIIKKYQIVLNNPFIDKSLIA